MKTIIKTTLTLLTVTTMALSCGSKDNQHAMNDVCSIDNISIEDSHEYALAANQSASSAEQASVRLTSPQIVTNYIATSATTSANDDENHKFFRTATLRFKVKDVVTATSTIEDIIIRNKGFIIRSNISNNRIVENTYKIDKDSLLTIANNFLEGNLDLKVPKELLDTTLRTIAPIAIHIDYRIVEAEDVTVKLMSEKLAQIRLDKKQKRIGNTISTRSGKLSDVMDAEEMLDQSLEVADKSYISTFITNEKIAYSVIKINVYQDAIQEKNIIPALNKYKPSFGRELISGLSGGWNIICTIFLFFVNIWPITLIATASVIIIYRKIKKDRKDV